MTKNGERTACKYKLWVNAVFDKQRYTSYVLKMSHLKRNAIIQYNIILYTRVAVLLDVAHHTIYSLFFYSTCIAQLFFIINFTL